MAGAGTSMLGSLLVFTVILSVQEIYRGKLASSELFTILGGFTSSLLFLFSLTESSGMKSDWGAVAGFKFSHNFTTIEVDPEQIRQNPREWWYNTTYHTAIRSTPFEIVYGQSPPTYMPYFPGESSSQVVHRSLQKREELINMMKFHLLRAQNRMKQYADSHRSAREFQIGNYVYLKLQRYMHHSLKNRNTPHKLSPRFYGPFLVTDRIGSQAYKLALPSDAAIHNVFHVSQLKFCPNLPESPPTLPQYLTDVGNSKEPEKILEKKMVKRHNKAVTKILVQWKGYTPEQATWKFYQDFVAKYPEFHP